MRRTTLTLLALLLAASVATPTPAGAASEPRPRTVTGWDGAPDLGPADPLPTGQVIDLASWPGGDGYWVAAADGGIFSFGAAPFHGSMGGIALNRPIVGMAATPDGGGYWLVASDGGVFSFGTARFHGSMGGIALNRPIVGMAATPDGGGYWLVASDGGVFSFGTAAFHGSLGNMTLNSPIVAMAPTAGGQGYLMAAADGGVFAFGDAPFLGSAAGVNASGTTDLAASATGYALLHRDGRVSAFNLFLAETPSGAAGELWPQSPSIGMALRPTGGYWVLHGSAITLEEGDQRTAVRAVEARLDALGYWPGRVDGLYDVNTRQAVLAFQKVAGLTQRDGVAGPETLRALEAASRPAPPVVLGDGAIVRNDVGVLYVVRGGATRHVVNAAVGAPATPTPAGSFSVLVALGGVMQSTRFGSLDDPAFFTSDGVAVAAAAPVPAATSGAVLVSEGARALLESLDALDPGAVVIVR